MQPETFGERLKNLRYQHNLTLRDLSDEMNISFSALGNYERNLREPSYGILKKLAEFFDVDVDYLIGISPCKKHTNNLVVSDLGLSEDAINVIKSIKDTGLSETLSNIIENDNFIPLLEHISVYQTEFGDKDKAEFYYNEFYNRLSQNDKVILPVDTIQDYEYLIFSSLIRQFEALVGRLNNL